MQQHIQAARQYSSVIAPDERYDKPSLHRLVNDLLGRLGWGNPRTKRTFDRWLATLDLTNKLLYGQEDLQEILILAYWLNQSRRNGQNLYFTELFRRTPQ